MKELDIEQGSWEWQQARVGIVTASQFKMLITKTGKPSAQRRDLLHELTAEHLLQSPVSDFNSDWMQRGTDLEASAVSFYEILRDVDTREVGFIVRDDGKVGCSPDRLVGDEGGLEIKCPSARVHTGYLLGMPHDQYRPQIQGCLWVTGRQWWDFLSYNPFLAPVVHRYERNEEYIKTLSDIVQEFLVDLEAAKEQVRQYRVIPDAEAQEVALW